MSRCCASYATPAWQRETVQQLCDVIQQCHHWFLSRTLGLAWKGSVISGPISAGPLSEQAFSVDGKAQEPSKGTQWLWELIGLTAV